MFSESSTCLFGQHVSCSTARWPVDCETLRKHFTKPSEQVAAPDCIFIPYAKYKIESVVHKSWFWRIVHPCHRWADTQSQSQGSPLKKRKRESSENGEPSSTSPFVLHGIKTPETPYGSRPGNRDPSPKTRKYWKLQLDELKRFDMTEQQKKEFEVRDLIILCPFG